MSANGQFIAYARQATNGVEGAVSRGEIYLYDRISGETSWASKDIPLRVVLMGFSSYACFDPQLSLDGRYLYFKSRFDPQPNARLYRYDIGSRILTFVAAELPVASSVSISRSGDFAAYETSAGIYVWDGSRLTNMLVAATIAQTQTCMLPSIAKQASRVTYLRYDVAQRLTSLRAINWDSGEDLLVSVAQNGEQPVPVTDFTPAAISEDGATVVYESDDPSIVSSDLNLTSDIFLRRLGDGSPTVLVSGRSAERPNTTWNLTSLTSPQAISAGGNRVAYLRHDAVPVTPGTVLPGDDNGYIDVWVRDLRTGAERFLGSPDFGTRDAVLSADGRYIAFLSAVFGFSGFPDSSAVYRHDLVTGAKILVASNVTYTSTWIAGAYNPSIAISADGNLVAFAADGALWLRDIATGSNHMVSVNLAGNGTGPGPSTLIAFAPDQHSILFSSAAMNLTADGKAGLFVRDLVAGKTRLVTADFRLSRNPPMATFSPDSRFVAYVTSADKIEVRDLVENTASTVCEQCFNPSLASGARWIAYETPVAGQTQVYFRDLATGDAKLVSRNLNLSSPGAGRSTRPQMSYDGRFIVFASRANDLVSGDANRSSDVFAYDRLRDTTLLLSANHTGTGSGNGSSMVPNLSADGRTVVFASAASDLTEGDYNGTFDVFVARLGGADTDADGMDDDWEMAYFNTLARDGSGDFDGDGIPDRDEYRAGTNPASNASVLQVLTVSALVNSGVTVVWSSTPGRDYRVQYKDSVDDLSWQEVPETIAAAGTTASVNVSSTGLGHRFFRVVQLAD